MDRILFFSIPMLMTFVVTVVLCRIQVARKKRVSVGTMFAGALSVPLIAIILATCFDPVGFWSTRDKGPGTRGILGLAAFITILCALPAGVVVAFYRKRSKRDEKEMA
jgi:O-antigen ligase